LRSTRWQDFSKLDAMKIPIVLVIGFMAFFPKAEAVLPTPDGCYPNFTTAEGCDALSLLTTGAGNTALGWRSLFLDTTGSFNTGVGGGALALNTADDNTAVGAAALLLNTTGSDNTAFGTDALVFNDSGSFNTANGSFALYSNTTGNSNTAVGDGALGSNTDGFSNTAIGSSALFGNTHGFRNIAVGVLAGSLLTTGSDNINIGNVGVPSEEETIRIGSEGGQTRTFIAGINGINEGGTISPVYINSDGQLGTQAPSSSRRFKRDIKPMDQISAAILALKPVTFQYKSDANDAPQFGLIAEEVAEVNPDLVVRDGNGEIYSVRYDAVNAMLLNEFLKEHRTVREQARKVQKLEATVAQQQKQIEALNAGLQEVSAQIELSGPAPRTVANDR
jgi:hypothetical protein